MKKTELQNLSTGNKVINKKDSTILEVVAMENSKYILSNGKCYSESTMYRWFDLAPVEEVDEPIEPTNTSEKVAVNENHEDHEDHTGDANSKVLEGENTIEQIIQEYNCHTQKMQQYTAVKSDNTKKTLIYIRVAKEGGYHFDISQKTWHKLNKAYAKWLTTNFNAGIKDKTRKLYRVSCNDLKIFRNLLLVALS